MYLNVYENKHITILSLSYCYGSVWARGCAENNGWRGGWNDWGTENMRMGTEKLPSAQHHPLLTMHTNHTGHKMKYVPFPTIDQISKNSCSDKYDDWVKGVFFLKRSLQNFDFMEPAGTSNLEREGFVRGQSSSHTVNGPVNKTCCQETRKPNLKAFTNKKSCVMYLHMVYCRHLHL